MKINIFINFDKVATKFIEDMEKDRNFVSSKDILISFLCFRIILDGYGINKNLENMKEEDAIEFVSYAINKDYPNFDKEQIISAVKIFFKWVKNNYKYLEEVKEKQQFMKRIKRIFKSNSI